MTTLKLKKQVPSSFLGQYRLDRKALKLGERTKGVPTLRSGTDSAGNPVIIRIWPRAKEAQDSDLQEIWRSETRHLHRLAGYPGISSYIAELSASGADDQGFYLVLSVGQRLPLELILADTSRPPRSNDERRLLWKNLLRIANGLEILHLQGLLHRNLTTWAILTSGGSEPDYQLTGFEWSMRIVEHAIPSPEARKLEIAGDHSFATDWSQFGEVASRILAIPPNKLIDKNIAPHEVADGITSEEIKLLRELTQVSPTDRMDGRVVKDRIEKILFNLSGASRSDSPSFRLIVRVGQGTPLASQIREISGRTIEVNDIESQEAFIRADLNASTAMLIRQGESVRLALRGERLTYKLVDYRRGFEHTPSNWDIAYCESTDAWAPVPGAIINQTPLISNSVNVMSSLQANQRGALRSRTTPWSSLLAKLAPEDSVPIAHKILKKSLILAQVIDYLIAASEIFPIQMRVTGSDQADGEGSVRIEVRPKTDDERERLSVSLGIKPSSERLKDLLNDDRYSRWTITDAASIGDRTDNATEWQYERAGSTDHHYIFSGERPAVNARQLFLAPLDSDGRDQQLKRRMKSFDALSEHAELCAMLVDPRARILSTHETPSEDPGFQSLDTSKQHAMKEAVGTMPLYLTQGPPGVGKTRLVKEIVRQALQKDPATRILLSAQSNHAVDHLLYEIQSTFDNEQGNDSVIIRCLPKEKRDGDAPYDVSAQAKVILKNLLESELLSNSSTNIQARIQNLARSFGIKNETTLPLKIDTARKAFEQLVLHSANLVFATTNSSDLERLLEERNQFDWTIIEEAGKATGGELITPLLLSARRLMIGDHKQLPPFGSETILRLLNEPEKISIAIKAADNFVGWQLRDETVDQIFDESSGDTPVEKSTFSALCVEASRNLLLFESLVDAEFQRISEGGRAPNVASSLTRQHRMHPEIAEVISHSFYNNKLKTDDDAIVRFKENKCPVALRKNSILPDRRFVWIDMPWVQETIGLREGEKFPRYTNRLEMNTILRVLESVQVSSNQKASLAILSPYSRQVALLSRTIAPKLMTSLQHINDFSAAGDNKEYFHTVDSFQGNEADLVIISLVRNNSHGSVGSALGFLASPNRMNVLLSRARHRLVVVGSLAFLRAVIDSPKTAQANYDINFLRSIVRCVDDPRLCSIVKAPRSKQ